ncbi:MAG: ChbG/HpnK family deacetylase [Verrucomicrobiota bacterium]
MQDVPTTAAPADGIRIITRGDDAGSTRSANLAIRECAETGLLRNISFLATAPEIQHAAEILRPLVDRCDFGLHTCLTSEFDRPLYRPVAEPSKIPMLLDSRGGFFRNAAELQAADVPVEQVVAEWDAQLSHLRRLGIEPTYVDVHMGVTWIGDYEQALAAFAERESLICNRAVERQRLPEPDGANTMEPIARFAAAVRAADTGTYFILGHPAYDDAEMRGIIRSGEVDTDIAAQRNQQRLLFLDDEVKRAFAEKGATAIRYSEA